MEDSFSDYSSDCLANIPWDLVGAFGIQTTHNINVCGGHQFEAETNRNISMLKNVVSATKLCYQCPSTVSNTLLTMNEPRMHATSGKGLFRSLSDPSSAKMSCFQFS
jgi:hypothetical protein